MDMLKQKVHAIANNRKQWYVVVVADKYAAVPIRGGTGYRLTEITEDAANSGVGLAQSEMAITDWGIAHVTAKDLKGQIFEVADTSITSRSVTPWSPPMACSSEVKS
jgi:hypothetical protein